MQKVSVIIPTYNGGLTIKQSIQSVFDQTYSDYEIIVVDDGSTDDTYHIINELRSQNEKVKYIYQDNKGRSAARNIGIQAAQGDYIAFLDSDDIFLPMKLKLQVLSLENNNDFGMVYSYVYKIEEYRYILEDAGHEGVKMSGWVYPELLFIKRNLITVPSVMVRKHILSEVGGFDEKMHICEDLDLWRRIARRYKVLQIEQPLAAVRYKPHDPTTLKEKIKARTFYYKKAIAEDPGLLKSMQPRLFSEMYWHYGIEAVNNRNGKLGLHLLMQSIRTDPFQFVRSCGGYSIGLARSGLTFLLQRCLSPEKYNRLRYVYRRTVK